MADIKDPIKIVKIGTDEYPLDATTLNGSAAGDFQLKENIVNTLSSDSNKYPSAKCVYDAVGDIERLLSQI